MKETQSSIKSRKLKNSETTSVKNRAKKGKPIVLEYSHAFPLALLPYSLPPSPPFFSLFLLTPTRGFINL